jgi:hypothetical protein
MKYFADKKIREQNIFNTGTFLFVNQLVYGTIKTYIHPYANAEIPGL